MKGYIRITLRSDLCAASGDGFSLSIDTDVCADRYGFPFIPSRRLKGCLREAAGYIGCEHIDGIFGVSGDVNSGSLRINDARLENYTALEAQAKSSKFNAEQVLALFTSVKASTAIENDTAKENSLRFTRVVDHYSPLDDHKRELVFVSEIEYGEEYSECLKRICKALRNIGYKRTRGYGSVKCEFVPVRESSCLSVDIPDDEKEYELRFTVRLNAPAMFVGKSSVETLGYIPGSAVLGAFAAGYLSGGKADAEFERLFLTGALKFSDMYLTDSKTVSEPAPAVLGKTKDTGEMRFVFSEDNKPDMPRPKAFKGGFLINKKEKKPETETIYHHGTKQGEKKKVLYTQECLCEGQLFSGRVTGKGSDLHALLPVLESGRINLGRSKSAQYSACDIIAADCVAVSEDKVKPGEVYALLCSDVLLIDEYANYSTDISVLAKELGAVLSGDDRAHSSLKYKTVTGYVSVGRFKRPHIRAFEKGSVLRFTSDKEVPRYIIIGERQNEGFGVVKFCTKNELEALGKDAPKTADKNTAAEGKLSELIKKNDAAEELRKAALDYADEKYERIKNEFNPSFVGRLLLMVGQAESKSDLDARVASIKTENKRKAAQKFIADAKEKYGNEWREFLRISLTVIKYRIKEAGK